MGTDFFEIVGAVANKDNRSEGDYIEHGLLMCGKCHTPKQKMQEYRLRGDMVSRMVSILCKCESEELDRQREADEKATFISKIRGMQAEYNLSDHFYRTMTFARDDCSNAEQSKICRNYVEQWEAVKDDNLGILFCGSAGTGKTFLAACVANGLLEKFAPTAITSFPRILNILQSTKDRQGFIDHLAAYELLVIDDLGTERDSAFAAEQVFNIIDSRARSGLPLIVTTNLTLEEMQNPPTMQLKRIYDRILEMCPIVIKMNGESRRAGNAERRKQKARELLLGKKNGGE